MDGDRHSLGLKNGLCAWTGFCVEVEDEPRQSRRASGSDIVNRRQAWSLGRAPYLGGMRLLGLDRRFLPRLIWGGSGVDRVERIEGKTWEAEESDQEGEGEDAPQN